MPEMDTPLWSWKLGSTCMASNANIMWRFIYNPRSFAMELPQSCAQKSMKNTIQFFHHRMRARNATEDYKWWRQICVWGRYLDSGLTSDKTTYRKISQGLEGARSGVKMFVLLWNLAGSSAAVIARRVSHFEAIGQFHIQISWLSDFARSYNKIGRLIRYQNKALVVVAVWDFFYNINFIYVIVFIFICPIKYHLGCW